VFADRWDKRSLMMRMDALRAVLVLLLIVVTGAIPLPFLAGRQLPAVWQLGVLYGTVFLANICSQFFNPANMALIGRLVEEPYRARASGLNQVIGGLAIIIGPALGALLFLHVGIFWSLLVDSLSFVVSFLTVGMISAGN